MLNDSINRFLGVLCYPLASMEMFWNDDIEEYIQEVNKEEQKIKELINIKQTLQGKLPISEKAIPFILMMKFIFFWKSVIFMMRKIMIVLLPFI